MNPQYIVADAFYATTYGVCGANLNQILIFVNQVLERFARSFRGSVCGKTTLTGGQSIARLAMPAGPLIPERCDDFRFAQAHPRSRVKIRKFSPPFSARGTKLGSLEKGPERLARLLNNWGWQPAP
jgi:hypothetical protein